MNPNEMMKLARKMQQQMEAETAVLEKKEFENEMQGVKVKFNGARQLLEIKIDDILVDPDDVDTLETMILLVVNKTLEEIDEAHDEIQNSASKI